jgi:hypothetical protein
MEKKVRAPLTMIVVLVVLATLLAGLVVLVLVLVLVQVLMLMPTLTRVWQSCATAPDCVASAMIFT